ncbi:hypothetical protein ABIB26_004159 [Arthrobacter sp. UYEF20]
MREPDLEPTPRSRLERAYDAFGSLPLIVLAGVLFVPLQAVLGWWPTLAIMITAGIVLITAIQLIVIAPLQKKRAAQDAERGLFECAHREPGSGLRSRWARGYARAEPNRLIFQLGASENGPLAGPLEIYSAPTAIGKPVKAPWTVFPGGLVVTLSSDGTTFQLAASRASLVLLNKWNLTNPAPDP